MPKLFNRRGSGKYVSGRGKPERLFKWITCTTWQFKEYTELQLYPMCMDAYDRPGCRNIKTNGYMEVMMIELKSIKADIKEIQDNPYTTITDVQVLSLCIMALCERLEKLIEGSNR